MQKSLKNTQTVKLNHAENDSTYKYMIECLTTFFFSFTWGNQIQMNIEKGKVATSPHFFFCYVTGMLAQSPGGWQGANSVNRGNIK